MESENQTTDENKFIGSSTIGRDKYVIEQQPGGNSFVHIRNAGKKGVVPKELQGAFTGPNQAEKAIASYLSKRNTPPTPYQARQKAKRQAAKKEKS